MIEKFEDLEFLSEDSLKQIEQKLHDKLNLSLQDLQQAICHYMVEKADYLVHDFVTIAPLGDYEQLLEDNEKMAQFLKTEAAKPEHWILQGMGASDVNPSLIEFLFICKAINDGNDLKGFVFVSLLGKIKHAFAQTE